MFTMRHWQGSRLRASSFGEFCHSLRSDLRQVMRHGATRDRLRKELDVLCFEMEAAGVMNRVDCVVIRGICDYADSHENKLWQEDAAATAAAYTEVFLSFTEHK